MKMCAYKFRSMALMIGIALSLRYTAYAALEGTLDQADCDQIAGWTWDSSAPNTTADVWVQVERSPGQWSLFRLTANAVRSDLALHGIGNGDHGFSMKMPDALKDGKSHVVQAYPVGSATQLWESPKSFQCPAGDSTVATYEGTLDVVNCDTILGWAWSPKDPSDAIGQVYYVSIYIDGRFVAAPSTNQFRQDLLEAGKGDGHHGFSYPFPSFFKDGQLHTVTVKFPDEATLLWNDPQSVSCAASE